MNQAGLVELREMFPWPENSPAFATDWGPAWFSDDEQFGHPRIFKWLARPDTQLIVELGSFVGRSVAGWLRVCPAAHVIAIDTWLGSPEHQAEPLCGEFLAHLLETFQSNLWDHRDRVTPVRMTTLEGLRLLHRLHILPQVIYVDADHSAESVAADVSCCLDLFPDAQIIGDDWTWRSVQAGVESAAIPRGAPIATCGGMWWFPKQTSLQQPAQAEQRPRQDKVITLTLYRRPEYARRLLDALEKCDGIQEYRVLMHIEPGPPEVLALARNAKFNRKVLVENADLLGCGPNTKCALDHGFQFANFVIHLEDDTVPGQDCLRYFEYAANTYQHDSTVFSVTSYSKGTPEASRFHEVVRFPWFTPWGWGTWRDRWTDIRDHWSNAPVTWDVCINQIRGDRVEIRPLLARTQNIGAEQGTHCPSAAFHRLNQFNEFGVWSVKTDHSGEFFELPLAVE